MGYIEECTDDQLRAIYKCYGATEETVERDVKTLMEWMEKKPYLPNVKDEKFLRLIFIRNGASLEKTKRALEKHYIFKARFADVIARMDPTSESFKFYYDQFTRFPLPKLTPELNRVFMVYFESSSDEGLSGDTDEALCFMITVGYITCMMSGPNTGFVVIADAKNSSTARVTILLSILRKLMLFGNTMYRTHKIYLLNSSMLLEPIFILGRQIDKKIFNERVSRSINKILEQQMIFWTKSEKDLVEVIPKECLPYEYGGTLGSLEELKEAYHQEMLTWKGSLDEQKKCAADLSKLPEDRKQIADMSGFGVEGSFRKLNLE